MRCFLRGFSFGLGVAGLASAGQAVRLLDDFTTGDYTHTIEWPETTDVHFVDGLDTGHDAWGNRQTSLVIQDNPHHVPVTITIGSGLMCVSAPQGMADGLSTELRTDWGLGPNPLEVDFSHDTEVWIDLDVDNPDGRFADLWFIYVKDAAGLDAVNEGFLSRPGGIRFRLDGFNRQPDWSRIRLFRFTQVFDSQGAAHPESYTVTSIYAVPEPCYVLALTVWLALSVRRRRTERASLA